MSCEKCQGKNPDLFFELQFSWEKNVFRLDPYPVLPGGDLGPRFVLTRMYPDISKGAVEVSMPVQFFYGNSPGIMRCWGNKEIIMLVQQVQKQYDMYFHDYRLNAFLVHQPTVDRRLVLSTEETRARGFEERGYVILPVQFFHIDYEVPKEIIEHAKLLKDLKL